MSKNAVLSIVAVLAFIAAGVLVFRAMGAGDRLDRGGHINLLRSKSDDELKVLRVEWAAQIEYHLAKGEDDRARSAQRNLDALDELLAERDIDPETIDPSIVTSVAVPSDK